MTLLVWGLRGVRTEVAAEVVPATCAELADEHGKDISLLYACQLL
jgi:hypothetical protein